MKLLALETSTEYCSAALWQDGVVLQRIEHAGQRHSQLLLPQCRALLAEAGTVLTDLDGVAFGNGPGSFTGLRIACAAAQGLAFAADVPVAGTGSLLTLAAAALDGQAGGRVIACLDARMGEVYHASYQYDGQAWVETSAPQVCDPSRIPIPSGDGWVGCGSGFAAYGDILAQRLGAALGRVDVACFPTAAWVAALAEPELRAGRGLAPEFALPVYVRDRVALKICERQ